MWSQSLEEAIAKSGPTGEELLFCMAFTGLMFRGLLIDGNESLEKLEVVKSICNRAPNTEDLMASERKQTTRAIFFFPAE